MARLLVVDDTPSVLRVVDMALEHHVVAESTVHGALHELASGTIDLVILDWMMPVVDGMDALTRIRSNDDLRRLPVIMLTARTDPGAEATCLRAGADAYLPKPFDPDVLERLVDSLLAQSPEERMRKRSERLSLLGS